MVEVVAAVRKLEIKTLRQVTVVLVVAVLQTIAHPEAQATHHLQVLHKEAMAAMVCQLMVQVGVAVLMEQVELQQLLPLVETVATDLFLLFLGFRLLTQEEVEEALEIYLQILREQAAQAAVVTLV
jgi:hypothetical protein